MIIPELADYSAKALCHGKSRSSGQRSYGFIFPDIYIFLVYYRARIDPALRVMDRRATACHFVRKHVIARVDSRIFGERGGMTVDYAAEFRRKKIIADDLQQVCENNQIGLELPYRLNALFVVNVRRDVKRETKLAHDRVQSGDFADFIAERVAKPASDQVRQKLEK